MEKTKDQHIQQQEQELANQETSWYQLEMEEYERNYKKQAEDAWNEEGNNMTKHKKQ